MRPAAALFLALISTLACHAATQPISADRPASTLASPVADTSAPTSNLSCVDEMSSIVVAARSESNASGAFPGVDAGNDIDIPLVTYSVSGDQIPKELCAVRP